MIWVFLLEILHIHEQFAAGKLNQSGEDTGTCTKCTYWSRNGTPAVTVE
jgi:hypothetical protein